MHLGHNLKCCGPLADCFAFAPTQSCQLGWQMPWGLRVWLCESLLRGVFDTLDESSYIDESKELVAALEGRLWPLMGEERG